MLSSYKGIMFHLIGCRRQFVAASGDHCSTWLLLSERYRHYSDNNLTWLFFCFSLSVSKMKALIDFNLFVWHYENQFLFLW